MPSTVPALRVLHQLLGERRGKDALDVVRQLGALQAQDYNSVLCSIGMRTQAPSKSDVEQALADGRLVRSWPIRGTLHVVPGEDLGWMLALTGPRRFTDLARRRAQLGLDEPALKRCEASLVKALRANSRLTREQVLSLWQHAGMAPDGQRGYHVLHTLALRGVICFGPRLAAQDTFVMMDTWLPQQRQLSGEEATCELARRYFTSHGPATDQDFARWSGLTLGEARKGRAAAGLPDETDAVRAPEVALLPAFDEYVLGYSQRGDVLDAEHAQHVVPGSNGMFMPTLLVRGRIVGTWKLVKRRAAALITIKSFAPIAARLRPAVARAAQRHGAFIGQSVELAYETL